MNVTTYRTFGSEQDAVDYRKEHGTGGWIFVPDPKPGEYMQCILFPPEFTPTPICKHALTRGLSGRLVA